MCAYLDCQCTDCCNNLQSAIHKAGRITGIIIPNGLLGLKGRFLGDFTHEVLNGKLDYVCEATCKQHERD